MVPSSKYCQERTASLLPHSTSNGSPEPPEFKTSHPSGPSPAMPSGSMPGAMHVKANCTSSRDSSPSLTARHWDITRPPGQYKKNIAEKLLSHATKNRKTYRWRTCRVYHFFHTLKAIYNDLHRSWASNFMSHHCAIISFVIRQLLCVEPLQVPRFLSHWLDASRRELLSQATPTISTAWISAL